MHLFKAKATLADYADLNRRYAKTADVLLFEDNEVKLDIVPHYFFSSVMSQLKKIAFIINAEADIPTIFEYVLGILWYKISERKGKILDYMKLSLDADLLPKTHAAGGEADIVYEYHAT